MSGVVVRGQSQGQERWRVGLTFDSRNGGIIGGCVKKQSITTTLCVNSPTVNNSSLRAASKRGLIDGVSGNNVESKRKDGGKQQYLGEPEGDE